MPPLPRSPAGSALADHGAEPHRKLERDGVISGYTVRTHDDYEQGRIRAHILITVLPKKMPAVVKALRDIPEVRLLHSVSGAYDLIALGVVGGVNEMDVLTDAIGAIDGWSARRRRSFCRRNLSGD